MGQKVNPHGLRVGVIKDWDSRWYADTKDGEFASNLSEDNKIEEINKVLDEVLSPYKDKADSIVLGCTHYSLIKDEINNV